MRVDMQDRHEPVVVDYETPVKRSTSKPPLSLMMRLGIWFGLTFVFAFALAAGLDSSAWWAVQYLLLPTGWIAALLNPNNVNSSPLIVSNAMLYALLVAFGVGRRRTKRERPAESDLQD